MSLFHPSALLVQHSLDPMHSLFSTDPIDDDYDIRSESSITGMSDSSLDRFPPRSESSATTHDIDMRSASPAPSVYSMTSSLREAAFRQEYGRGLNNFSDVYQLPADEEELQRLGASLVFIIRIRATLLIDALLTDHQHEMFKAVMGRYPPPLPGVLQEDPAQPKTVVDLGCGSGSWYAFAHRLSILKAYRSPNRILDVARDFSHCTAVAIDLVPMQALCVSVPTACPIAIHSTDMLYPPI